MTSRGLGGQGAAEGRVPKVQPKVRSNVFFSFYLIIISFVFFRYPFIHLIPPACANQLFPFYLAFHYNPGMPLDKLRLQVMLIYAFASHSAVPACDLPHTTTRLLLSRASPHSLNCHAPFSTKYLMYDCFLLDARRYVLYHTAQIPENPGPGPTLQAAAGGQGSEGSIIACFQAALDNEARKQRPVSTRMHKTRH